MKHAQVRHACVLEYLREPVQQRVRYRRFPWCLHILHRRFVEAGQGKRERELARAQVRETRVEAPTVRYVRHRGSYTTSHDCEEDRYNRDTGRAVAPLALRAPAASRDLFIRFNFH